MVHFILSDPPGSVAQYSWHRSFPIDGFAHVVRFGVDDEILAAGGSNGKVYVCIPYC